MYKFDFVHKTLQNLLNLTVSIICLIFYAQNWKKSELQHEKTNYIKNGHISQREKIGR